MPPRAQHRHLRRLTTNRMRSHQNFQPPVERELAAVATRLLAVRRARRGVVANTREADLPADKGTGFDTVSMLANGIEQQPHNRMVVHVRSCDSP